MVGFTSQRKERKRQRQRDKDRERALKARRFFEVTVFRTMVKPPWAGNNVLNFYFFQNFLQKIGKRVGSLFFWRLWQKVINFHQGWHCFHTIYLFMRAYRIRRRNTNIKSWSQIQTFSRCSFTNDFGSSLISILMLKFCFTDKIEVYPSLTNILWDKYSFVEKNYFVHLNRTEIGLLMNLFNRLSKQFGFVGQIVSIRLFVFLICWTNIRFLQCQNEI